MQQAGHLQPQWHNEGRPQQQRGVRPSVHPSGDQNLAPSGNANMSVGEQLMQIDQAITLTLQEIDANFARTHQTITSRILPAIKRYGIASHNTWQGAKFWHRFFETASDINLAPGRAAQGAEETSVLADGSDTVDGDDDARYRYGREDQSKPRYGGAPDESGELHEDDFEPPKMSDASVAASKRLMVQQGQADVDESLDEAMTKPVFDRRPAPTGLSSRRSDGHRSNEQQGGPSRAVLATPRSGKKGSNPFNRKASSSDNWNGIADLRKTPLALGNTKKAKASKTTKDADGEEDDDSLAWPVGMSPPVTMQFSVPRSRYDKTPAKEAARMVVDDLLRTVEGSTPAARRMMMMQREAATSSAAAPRTSSQPTPASKTISKGGANKVVKGRPSMPTPPTITKRIGGTTRTSAQRQKESTPKGMSSASRLMDQDEQGQSTYEEEEEDMHVSPPNIQSLTMQDDDDDDEDSDNEDESDEDEDGAEAGTLPSLSRPRGVLSRDQPGATGRQTGYTASSISHSIDEDTLFGIRDPSLNSASKNNYQHGRPVSKQSTTAAAARAHVAATPSTRPFQPMGQPQDLGTVFRGRPLLDDDRMRDETFSAPSPTPASQHRD